jgi:branched-chain amino acid transport system substrate-binding protein
VALLAGAMTVAVIACGGGATSDTGGSYKEVTVNSIVDMTGPNSYSGKPVGRGMELAAKDINDKGGFKVGGQNYHLVVKTKDTTSSVDQTVSLFRQSLAEGAKFVFGPVQGNETLASVELTKNRPVMHMVPAGESFITARHKNPAGYPNVMPMQLIGTQRQACYIPAFVKQFKPKTVVILMIDNASGKTYQQGLPPQLKSAGVSNVYVEPYATGTTDFAPLLTRAMGRNPDLFVVGYQGPDIDNILRQAHDLGIDKKVPFAGTEGSGGQDPITAFGQPLENWMWVQSGPPFGSATPEEQRAVQLWKQAYKEDPAAPTATINEVMFLGYDVGHMLVNAMKKAGTVDDVNKIISAFEGVTYKGLNSWTVEKDGTAIYDIWIGRYVGGKATYTVCNITPLPPGA